ncbi:MAG: hypothetical protein ACYSWO_30470 [Planctomycetota bacterium]|jgi:NAD-dependent dihydropyrimidine dehydrogenase PreA subunit
MTIELNEAIKSMERALRGMRDALAKGDGDDCMDWGVTLRLRHAELDAQIVSARPIGIQPVDFDGYDARAELNEALNYAVNAGDDDCTDCADCSAACPSRL